MESKICRQRREESAFLLAGTAYAEGRTVGLGHGETRLYPDHRAQAGGGLVMASWGGTVRTHPFFLFTSLCPFSFLLLEL